MNHLLLVPPNKEGFIRDTFYGCWHKSKFVNYSWPPLYLYQLNSIIKDSKVLDLSKKKFNDALENVLKYNPKTIMINTGTFTIKEDKQFLKAVKNKLKCNVIAFGQHPTVNPRDTLSDGTIDICIKGEPENIIKEIILSIDDKTQLKKIKGVCFKNHISKQKNIIKNLDDIPFPKRQNKNDEYFNPLVINEPYTTMLITRGCPFDCTFCTVPTIYGKIFRKRSIGNVIDEIKQILKLRYKEIFIRDENLTLHKKYLIELCNEIINQKLKFKWICNSRVDTIDKALLKIMKQAGCHLIKFGVESSNQKMLNKLKKGTTKKQIIKSFKLCKETNIETLGHFMIGNPGESKKDIKDTVDFALNLNPTYASFDILINYPGTVIQKNNTLTNAELELMHDYSFKKFYLRPKFIIKTIMNTKSIVQFKNRVKSTLAMWKKMYL